MRNDVGERFIIPLDKMYHGVVGERFIIPSDKIPIWYRSAVSNIIAHSVGRQVWCREPRACTTAPLHDGKRPSYRNTSAGNKMRTATPSPKPPLFTVKLPPAIANNALCVNKPPPVPVVELLAETMPTPSSVTTISR